MHDHLKKAALPPMRRFCLVAIAASLAALAATPAAALTQSWNGWRWARSGPLAISLGNNLSAAWSERLAPTADAWSVADNIAFTFAAGRTDPATCGAVYASVQVCSGNYGFNGWLGYTNVWLSNGYIVQATVRLNDSYFASAKYNTEAWKQMTICQELGHSIGLDHTNTSRTNANTGSCMDYTNDPSGTKGGSNGTLANTGPNDVDIAALNDNYAIPGGTQLSQTKPTLIAGAGLGIDDGVYEFVRAVPEPSTWALLIAGFGLTGAMQRRRRLA